MAWKRSKVPTFSEAAESLLQRPGVSATLGLCSQPAAAMVALVAWQMARGRHFFFVFENGSLMTTSNKHTIYSIDMYTYTHTYIQYTYIYIYIFILYIYIYIHLYTYVMITETFVLSNHISRSPKKAPRHQVTTITRRSAGLQKLQQDCFLNLTALQVLLGDRLALDRFFFYWFHVGQMGSFGGSNMEIYERCFLRCVGHQETAWRSRLQSRG